MHSILSSNLIPSTVFISYTYITQPPENIHYAALVIGGSILIEGVIHENLFSLFVLVI